VALVATAVPHCASEAEMFELVRDLIEWSYRDFNAQGKL
jgi:hypothetical protein